MSTEDICPICRGTPNDIFVTSCGHMFCGRCICEYFYRQHFVLTRGRHSNNCPVCRQSVTCCSSTTTEDCMLHVAVGRVRMVIDYGVHGSPTKRLCVLFCVPSSSLKLILKGKLVSGDDNLRAAASSKACLTFLSTRAPPLTLRLLVSKVIAVLWGVLLRLYILSRPVLKPIHRQCSSLYQRHIKPWSRITKALIFSVNPEYAAVVQPGTGAQAPAHQSQGGTNAAAPPPQAG